MDINALFTDEGLRNFTATVRDQHVRDAQQYGQIADIVRRRLEQTPIEGDRWMAKRLRAWKVARQLKAMQKASGEAASKAEALYATYVNEVLELPQRRAVAEAKKLERKNGRQAAVGAAVAGSLNRTVTALNTPQEQPAGTVPQARPAEFVAPESPFGQWPMAAGGERPTSTINDYFAKGEQG
ncbi:hypothetical protein AMK17_37840 [Streptomyces sp. CB00072]|uniref:hypothetical protein n=1 Tax=Streptomyces sp. CB00072 TaxID=1703928 RepID=UPI00093FB716|nr:hypothetical protein [Streptomyces sp. CB00072]OKI49422.1 hypothetical protein AMK17_37840 [Streptomyces sp. CB00072]